MSRIGEWDTESVLAAGGNDGPNNLAGIPQGLQQFGGTLFNVEGIVQLGSRHLRMVGKEYPERVSGVKVHERCRRLHLLHGTGWAAGAAVYCAVPCLAKLPSRHHSRAAASPERGE